MIKYLLILYFVLTALIGEYVPQRDENGVLLAKQCWGSTGTCWCQYTRKRNILELPKQEIAQMVLYK